MRPRWAGLAAIALTAGLAACDGDGPQEIDPAADACSRCRMSIDQLAHAGEMVTSDGRVRKYDSLGCLVLDHADEAAAGRTPRAVWVLDYHARQWLRADQAYFALAELPTDHMGYGIAATGSQAAALKLTRNETQKVVRWRHLREAVAAREAQRHE